MREWEIESNQYKCKDDLLNSIEDAREEFSKLNLFMDDFNELMSDQENDSYNELTYKVWKALKDIEEAVTYS